MMSKAYELSHNLDHIKTNQDYDAWHVFEDRKERFHKLFWRSSKIEYLPPHRFEGKVEKRLSWLDYPRVDLGYPIMSQKMRDILVNIGSFQHQSFDLLIYDWKKKEEVTNNFIFLHLLEKLDILDVENTEYYEASGRVRNAVLKKNKEGYPPLFMVNHAGLRWFISEEAKEALENAGIEGTMFISLIDSEERKTFSSKQPSKLQSTEELLSFKPVFPSEPAHVLAPGIEGLLEEYFGQSYDELYQKYNSYRIIPLAVASYKERVDPVAVKLSISEIEGLIDREYDEKTLKNQIFPKYGIKVEMSKLGVTYIGFLERVHEELVGKRLYY